MVKYSEVEEEAKVMYGNIMCSILKKKITFFLFKALQNRNSDALNILAKLHCEFVTIVG